MPCPDNCTENPASPQQPTETDNASGRPDAEATGHNRRQPNSRQTRRPIEQSVILTTIASDPRPQGGRPSGAGREVRHRRDGAVIAGHDASDAVRHDDLSAITGVD